MHACGDEVAVLDTLAADQELDGVNDAAVGSREYVEYIVANMRAHAPGVAAAVDAALRGGHLKYFEVRQLIDAAGAIGDIEVREFSL